MTITITNFTYQIPDEPKKWFAKQSEAYMACWREICIRKLPYKPKDLLQVVEKTITF